MTSPRKNHQSRWNHRNMPEQSMLPWDDTFPREVVHIANPTLALEVRWYGQLSTPQGAVPVVAERDGHWYAGEAQVIDGVPTLMAVNMYGDESTARQYARSIFVL